MQWSSFNLVCLALCCFHTESEPLHIENQVRTRRSDERDGLALSREIFRNITKKLREHIQEGPTDNDHLLQGQAEESRQYAPYQELHHHERHWGPYFEEKNITQVSAHVGAEALLNCRVVMLKDKTVMWLRHATETAQLLTVGPAPYAGDNRVASKFQYPNNWRLSINPVKWSDAGRYMCQISTHPPRTIYTDLTVLPPVLTINGDSTHDVKDKFYKAGSSIKLSCVISDEYISTLPTKVPIIITTPTTPLTTTTELTTKMSTIFNRIDLMLNKSWSVETTTLTSTVSIITTKSETTTEMTTQPAAKPVLNNIYGLVWRKQGKEIVDFISWRNMRFTLKPDEIKKYFGRAEHKLSGTLFHEIAPLFSYKRSNVFRVEDKKRLHFYTKTFQFYRNNEATGWYKSSKYTDDCATFSVSSASQNDSGLYSCHLLNHSQVIINVHVLSGENQAAVHHDTWNKGSLFWQPQICLLTIFTLLSFYT